MMRFIYLRQSSVRGHILMCVWLNPAIGANPRARFCMLLSVRAVIADSAISTLCFEWKDLAKRQAANRKRKLIAEKKQEQYKQASTCPQTRPIITDAFIYVLL